MAMALPALYDVVGIDLGWRSRELAGLGSRRADCMGWTNKALCENERFGQKSGM